MAGPVSEVAREYRSRTRPAALSQATLAKKIDEYRDGTSSFCIAKESQRRARLEQRNGARVVSNVVAGDNEMAPFQRRTDGRPFRKFERPSWKKETKKRGGEKEENKKKTGLRPIAVVSPDTSEKLYISEIARRDFG